MATKFEKYAAVHRDFESFFNKDSLKSRLEMKADI